MFFLFQLQSAVNEKVWRNIHQSEADLLDNDRTLWLGRLFSEDHLGLRRFCGPLRQDSGELLAKRGRIEILLD